MSYIDDFLNEPEKDTREGNKTLIVNSVEVRTWDDGGQTANLAAVISGVGSKIFVKVPCGPWPSEAIVKELGAIINGDVTATEEQIRSARGRKFGLRLRRQLETNYKVSDPATIQPGFEFDAAVKKNKKTGYLNVDKILAKGAAGVVGGVAASTDNPF